MTHPQNQRDAIPDQGTPIGPVTPGTGATDLGKLWGATGSIGLSVGVLVFGYDPIGAQMLPIDVTNDGNDVGQLNLNPNTKLNVVPISGGGTPASNVIPGTLPGAAVLVGAIVTVNGNGAGVGASAGQLGVPAVDLGGRIFVTTGSLFLQDTFTATGNGSTNDANTVPCRDFSLQVTQTGAVTSWDVRLEASLDGVGWTQLLAHTNVDGSGVMKSTTLRTPARFFRNRCAGLVLGGGTNVVARALGVQ